LLLYGGVACFILSAFSRGFPGAFSFLLAFAVMVLSGLAISSALQIADRKTIASFRRTIALLLGGEILWLLVAAPGAAYSWASGSSHPLTNAMLFGSFAAAGFEFLIINGAFEKNVTISFILALIHPASTLVVLRSSELSVNLDYLAVASGALALLLLVSFPLLMKRRRTSLGADTLSLFQAFMKTWTAGQSDDLEAIISEHSEEVDVTTKVMRFRTKSGDVFLVLPGVHPGPFHPVGSYDLPGVVTRAFTGLGPVMTLHRPGGHEMNLATKAETGRYAQTVLEFAKSIPAAAPAMVRGPIHSHVGKASASATAFSNDLLLTISFAPLGSDDIDTKVEAELARPAADFGFDVSVVDAHNSIDPDLQSPATDDPRWRHVFEAASASQPRRASLAYAHSSEIDFKGQGDLTENGMGMLMVQTDAGQSVLVLADANNSVPGLRKKASEALGAAGYDLIEFCTSDSHNLAARGLTVERGYEALGEVTSIDALADAVVKMAKLAETRLSPADYGSAKMKMNVRLFGSKALEEFATITQSSSGFSRNYFRFATTAVVALLVVALIF
jgi:putative membrane protein